ncbi:MAG: NAD(P)/FAD-dependent oxidoreductase [Chloroflexota bacterium]
MNETFDLIVIGSGEAGQAATHEARRLGGSVAVIERDLFGGSCAHWACIPSKALLHAAAIHKAGGDFPWEKAAAFRDYQINRENRDYPDDARRIAELTESGATTIRGSARITGRGTVEVTAADGTSQTLTGRSILIAIGTNSTIPTDIDGLAAIKPWTNREATSTRTLPRSIVIVGPGPTGLEMAQVFARYGVRTTLLAPRDRVYPTDHPRNAAAIAESLTKDGVDIRTNVRATRVLAHKGTNKQHQVVLSDGSTVEGEEILLAVGRTVPFEGLGLESVGITPVKGKLRPDDHLRLGDGIYVAGDAGGPEMHTHLAVYQGELVGRLAMGQAVTPDYSAIPHATYTDPTTAGVGLQLEQAREQGHDAFEETIDYAHTAPGEVSEAGGHVTIVVDRVERRLLGAFIAAPGAADAIGQAVLAVKTRTPLDVLADTINPFPTTVRVLGYLFGVAAKRL